MEIPKGASNKVDLIAAKVIQNMIFNNLILFQKHFKNRDKAIHLMNQNTINKRTYALVFITNA